MSTCDLFNVAYHQLPLQVNRAHKQYHRPVPIHYSVILVLFSHVSSFLTRHPSVPQAEKVSEWPENGGEWSDEDAANMDCGLLQAMAEEDEEINVHNEETFGMGVCVCVRGRFTFSQVMFA